VQFVDKEKLRPLTARIFEKTGIHGEPIGAEELQKMVAACGVKPEGNIFSRGIIEMREE
jgi:pyrroloquinoline quinone (PQQ) biosynthesis protein C